jgi:mannose-6-phosphate isomerase-like protein (cupin superfamily)
MRRGKIWGSTETLYQSGVKHAELLRIVPGGSCSWHHHRNKWNDFFVVAGTLVIEVDQSKHYGDIGGAYDLIDRTVLGPGEYTAVPPGVEHRFVNEGDEVVIAREDYWAPELSVDDIARHGTGAVLETGTS